MIRIGLQKPGNNWVSRQIAAHDAPGLYSHAALFFGDDLVFEAHAEFGVRFRRYSPDPARWVTAILPLSAEDELKVREWCELHAGAGYDFCGVARFKAKVIAEDSEKFFCSEAVVSALAVVGMFPGVVASEVSPNRLATLLSEL